MELHNVIWTKFEEIPIYNWNEASTTGDLSFLIKDNKRISQLNYQKLADVWLDLQQQYFDEFGVEPEIVDRIKTLEKIVKLNKEFIETKNRVLLNFITIEEEKLNAEGKSFKFYQVLDAIEKYKGFQIDPKTYPAIKWFHALKQMGQKNNNG